MTPQVIAPKNVIVQGITGVHGSFQTLAMISTGTNVVAGTTPGKAGQSVHGIPVYNTVADIQSDFTVDASVIFVPAKFAKSAILEAVRADIPLIICVTEGIPIHDMIDIKNALSKSESILIGPNSPGIILPGLLKLGIIPAEMSLAGDVAIVSRSGTLTYETMASLTDQNVGQKYVIGVGGDPIRGIGFIDCLRLFENDPDVKKIVLIGEIGGTDEQAAAEFISKHVTKPVFGYIAGHHAPEGVQMGHAGAILGGKNESAASKTEALNQAGVKMANSISGLVQLVINGL